MQRQAQVKKRVAFGARVTCLIGDDETLLIQLNGSAQLAQFLVSHAQAAQHVAFVAAVADLADDDKSLLVKLNGAAGLAQSVIGIG